MRNGTNYFSEDFKGTRNLGDTGVDVRIILKRTFRIKSVNVYWLQIVFNGGFQFHETKYNFDQLSVMNSKGRPYTVR